MTLTPLAAPFADLFERPRQFVFLVSHMRSFSSLLGHLLAETDAIDGYSELHRSYESDLDLVRMAIDVQQTHAEPLSGDYLFDKLLHRASTIAPQLAERVDVHVILSLRTPMATISSMVELGERDRSVRWAAEPDRALLHYQRRLDDICELAELTSGAAYLVADDLLGSTRLTLDAIANYLQLDEPIPERYSLRPRTGETKFGDSSPAISTGTIEQRPEELRSFSAQVEVGARDSFQRALGRLRRLDLHPIGEPDTY